MISNQQISENKTIDARTFPEIWESCTSIERSKISHKVAELLDCSTVAVWNYGVGNYAPKALSAKKDVVRVLRNVLKIQTSPETLFPAK